MENIGIGGVMAEIAFLSIDNKPVKKQQVINGLCNRFGISKTKINGAIWMAEICGVIEIIDNELILKRRG